MRRFIAVASALTIALTMPAVAAAQASQAKPEPPKTEAKPAPSVAGRWTVSIDPGSGPMQLPMELKVDGKKLSGSLTGPQGESVNLAGELGDAGKLTFAISTPDGMNVSFKGALKDDGTLAGTLDFGQGEFPWTATRVK